MAVVERDFSRDYHDLEVEKIWRKDWQVACRKDEFRRVGDSAVYETAQESVEKPNPDMRGSR